MCLLAQRADQRIITETVPAIHATRARRNVDDVQSSVLLRPANRRLENFTPVKCGCITFVLSRQDAAALSGGSADKYLADHLFDRHFFDIYVCNGQLIQQRLAGRNDAIALHL